MSEAKMTPESSFNAIVPGPGDSGKNRDKSPKTVASLEPPSQEFQCIVCKLIKKSPTEMHQHQSSCHTAEELSLSIIGLQILYNMYNYSKAVTPSKSESDNTVVDLTNDNNEQEISSPHLISDLNQPLYPEVQKEPICLKVSVPDSDLKQNNLNAKNHNQDSKTLIQMNNRSLKNSQCTMLSTKRHITVPVGHQKHRKEIPILPALPKIKDIQIQFGIVKNFPENKTIQDGFVNIGVSQIIQNKILGRTLVSHDVRHLSDQTFLTNKESAVTSQSEPICLKLSSPNFSLNSIKVENQSEKLEGIFKMSEMFFKEPDDFKESEKTFKRPELTIEKIDKTFKKPESVVKKPAVTVKKLSTYIKKPEEIKSKEKMNILKNQSTGHFNKNLNNICNDMQKVCLKRPRSKSPSRKLEPSFEIILEPPLQKSEPDFVILESILKNPTESVKVVKSPPKTVKSVAPLQKSEPSFEIILEPPLQKSEPDFALLESILKNPVASVEIVEPPLKKLKSVAPLQKSETPFEIILEPPLQKSEPDFALLESILKKPLTSDETVEPLPKKLNSVLQVPLEEIKNEAFLKKRSSPIIEVGDDAWYESVKNKLYLESELPTDITNIAMQDFPNQSFGVSQIVTENFNYNDLSSEAFMNFDSYLMAPEIQSQDDLNSTSEVFMDNNLTLQSLNEIPELDCSNADLLFGNNQQLLSRVDPDENTWNFDGNPVYTELLPVFYS